MQCVSKRDHCSEHGGDATIFFLVGYGGVAVGVYPAVSTRVAGVHKH